ncbi:hypothetical protein DFJ58DRAFT_848344 [Suillus subalutaceus]|uniref:uncharacterized protein n=1 Tax=Suillus subalutaceus TaxID=48586 RepID=UPI001B85DFAF|nr:uncharacterized protein DFJ58DRAFT_848344 [Suillus subalutaceus]KAG1830954.1 hypothetical protein DFJ58DRAFT_848344 [Suillus subalutaceus]
MISNCTFRADREPANIDACEKGLYHPPTSQIFHIPSAFWFGIASPSDPTSALDTKSLSAPKNLSRASAITLQWTLFVLCLSCLPELASDTRYLLRPFLSQSACVSTGHVSTSTPLAFARVPQGLQNIVNLCVSPPPLHAGVPMTGKYPQRPAPVPVVNPYPWPGCQYSSSTYSYEELVKNYKVTYGAGGASEEPAGECMTDTDTPAVCHGLPGITVGRRQTWRSIGGVPRQAR